MFISTSLVFSNPKTHLVTNSDEAVETLDELETLVMKAKEDLQRIAGPTDEETSNLTTPVRFAHAM